MNALVFQDLLHTRLKISKQTKELACPLRNYTIERISLVSRKKGWCQACLDGKVLRNCKYLAYHQFSTFSDLKLRFSKKATKINEIFTVDLTLCTYLVSVKSPTKISSIFVAFLENTNFNFEDSKF